MPWPPSRWAGLRSPGAWPWGLCGRERVAWSSGHPAAGVSDEGALTGQVGAQVELHTCERWVLGHRTWMPPSAPAPQLWTQITEALTGLDLSRFSSVKWLGSIILKSYNFDLMLSVK